MKRWLPHTCLPLKGHFAFQFISKTKSNKESYLRPFFPPLKAVKQVRHRIIHKLEGLVDSTVHCFNGRVTLIANVRQECEECNPFIASLNWVFLVPVIIEQTVSLSLKVLDEIMSSFL